jgi:DNA invertase Pin-like site-specific DNA recombinase
MREIAKIEKPAPYRKYIAEQMIDALAESMGMISPAARKLGCSRTTVRRYLAEYPEIAEAIEDANEEVNDIAELKLLDAIKRGEAWAICFRLKTKAKNRGYVEKAELTGANSGPIKLRLVYDE